MESGYTIKFKIGSFFWAKIYRTKGIFGGENGYFLGRNYKGYYREIIKFYK